MPAQSGHGWWGVVRCNRTGLWHVARGLWLVSQRQRNVGVAPSMDPGSRQQNAASPGDTLLFGKKISNSCPRPRERSDREPGPMPRHDATIESAAPPLIYFANQRRHSLQRKVGFARSMDPGSRRQDAASSGETGKTGCRRWDVGSRYLEINHATGLSRGVPGMKLAFPTSYPPHPTPRQLTNQPAGQQAGGGYGQGVVDVVVPPAEPLFQRTGEGVEYGAENAGGEGG